MNFKTTLLLLLVLIASGGAYLLTRSALPADVERVKAVPQALIEAGLVDRVSIQVADERLVIQHEDGRWFQTEPVRFAVTDEAVELILSAAFSLTPQETLTPSSPGTPSLEAIGLATPATRVTLQVDGNEHTLKLNAYQPGQPTYVQVDEGPSVYAVDPTLHRLLADLNPKKWRPEKLPVVTAERVTSVLLTLDDKALKLTHDADGWRLGDDAEQRADTPRAAQLAAVQPSIIVKRYVADAPTDLSAYGLNEPWATLTATSPEGDTTLQLGGSADLAGNELFATWTDKPSAPPVVFVIDREVVEPLMVDPQSLHDTRLVTSLPGSLRGVRIVRTGQETLEVTLRPDGKGYAFADPQPGYAPDTGAVSGLLRSLLETRAIEFTRAPDPAQAPLAVIELKLTAKRVERLRIYADRDGRQDKWLVVREIEPIAAVVPADSLSSVLAPLISYRNRHLDAQPYGPETFGTITFTSPAGVAHQLTMDSGRWQPQAATLAEPEAWAALIRWLANPVVDDWHSGENLDQSVAVITLQLGKLGLTYRVDPDTGLASRSDHSGTFQLSDEVLKLWRTKFFTQ